MLVVFFSMCWKLRVDFMRVFIHYLLFCLRFPDNLPQEPNSKARFLLFLQLSQKRNSIFYLSPCKVSLLWALSVTVFRIIKYIGDNMLPRMTSIRAILDAYRDYLIHSLKKRDLKQCWSLHKQAT